MRVSPLAELRLAVAARPGTAAAEPLGRSLAGQPLPLAALAGMSLIGLDRQSGVRLQVEGRLRGLGTPPRFRVEAGGWDAARECARQGLGAAILPLALLRREDAEDLVVRLLEPSAAILHSLVERDDPAEPALDALEQALLRSAEGLAEEVERTWRGRLL